LCLRSDNKTRLRYTGKKLVQCLEGLGLPVGAKRGASIPSEILRLGLVVPLIPGVYHAEWTIYRR
jgi:hypothetical protein